MTEIQLRSEYYVSKSREKYGSNAEPFSSIEGINGDLRLSLNSRSGACSTVSTQMIEESKATPFRTLTSGTPNWCHVAFMFERQRMRSERTDWGFVAPVWIAIGLFCTLVQVIAFQTLFSVFG